MKKLTRKQMSELIVSHVGQTKQLDNVIQMVAAHLIETKRSKELPLLIRDIASLSERKHSHTLARVVSARKLDAPTIAAIQKLVSVLDHSKTVEIDNHIEPTLLGGAVIQTPQREIDVSVRGRLDQIKSLASERN